MLSDIVSSKEIVFILNEDDSTIKNKSDFLYTKQQTLDSLDSTHNDAKISQAGIGRCEYEEYDLEYNYESGNESSDDQITSSKQHLNIGSRVEKMRSSQSSPKIFDNQTLPHANSNNLFFLIY